MSRNGNGLHLLPRGFKAHKRGSCVLAAFLLIDRLEDSRDRIVEGYVGYPCLKFEHTWFLIDGNLYDPTRGQFAYYERERGKMQYWPIRVLKPSQYCAMRSCAFMSSPFWRQRITEFLP